MNSYTCLCLAGFTDSECATDIYECDSSPCVNGACIDNLNSYTCDCYAGFVDTRCSTEVDECSSNPCADRICIDEVNQYRCICHEGYTGLDCVEINECNSNPCVHGSCTDALSSYSCSCDDGFRGVNCEAEISLAGVYNISFDYISSVILQASTILILLLFVLFCRFVTSQPAIKQHYCFRFVLA